jgi:hypothetical protein
MRLNSQTRIIVATAIALAGIDIAVRVATAPKSCTTDVVTAREFRLTDDRGNVRMTIQTDANGEPGMRMYDQNGALRLQLDSWQNTPSLILLDRDENRRVYYGMNNEDGSGLMSVYAPDGSTIATLDASGDRPELNLLNGSMVRRDGGQTMTVRGASVTLSSGGEAVSPSLR